MMEEQRQALLTLLWRDWMTQEEKDAIAGEIRDVEMATEMGWI